MWIFTLLKSKRKYQVISHEQAMDIMKKDKNYKLIDVRTPVEYQQGHIKSAVNIPNETIGKKEPSQLKKKDQNIIVYCFSGYRSRQTCRKLAKMGYTNIYSMEGINSWQGKIVR